MTEENSMEVSGAVAGEAWINDVDPGCLLRMSRGFSCLFWSMPLLAAVHAGFWIVQLPLRWVLGAWLACFLPLVCGLWMLRADETPPRNWESSLRSASRWVLIAICLCPFLVWWKASPLNFYFAGNAAAYLLAMIILLTQLNRLAGAFATGLGDVPLRRESRAGWIMVVWLSVCTIGALVWLFHRSGILDAGASTVLAQLSELPHEARTLFLLPYAMTAYVMWRAKETGFRRASAPAP